MNIFKHWLRDGINALATEVCRREFKSQEFQGLNERSVEYRFVFEQITRYYPRHILDVGTGKSALPQLMRNCGPLVSAIDNIDDYWPKGMSNRHYHIIQDNIITTRLPSAEFDMVTCISVLEHIVEHSKAISSMVALLKPGGHLVLTFPYNERQYVSNIYALAGSIGADVYPFSTQAFSRSEVESWCYENPVSVIQQEWWKFFDGEFWTLGNAIWPPEQTGPELSHQISCLVLQKASS